MLGEAAEPGMLTVPSMAFCSAALARVNPATEQGQKNQKCDEKSVSELFFRPRQGPNIIHQNPRAAPQSRQGNPGRRGDFVLLAQQKSEPGSKCTAAGQENVTVFMLHNAPSKSQSEGGWRKLKIFFKINFLFFLSVIKVWQ